ncbi:hypothetical protein NLG97_g2025 [Lecanicillium saksenae]|uniref:Uncharacterized protein n=1 Tax=Lecanicillium saksenae TaxID=468837 RepID=A0ACC1R654_9HYPO|nr:hypothetical protein NLG97_g2025 [Lecanicillium saksenae]
MPFIGTPRTAEEIQEWIEDQRLKIDYAMSRRDWRHCANVILYTICGAEGIFDLEGEIIILYRKLAICYDDTGDAAAAAQARAIVDELRAAQS